MAVVCVLGREMRVFSSVVRANVSQQRSFSSSGWQQRDPSAARSISGMPDSLAQRRAVIFRPAKVFHTLFLVFLFFCVFFYSLQNAMQSGKGNQQEVKLQFQSNGRWENPLMGWASTAV